MAQSNPSNPASTPVTEATPASSSSADHPSIGEPATTEAPLPQRLSSYCEKDGQKIFVTIVSVWWALWAIAHIHVLIFGTDSATEVSFVKSFNEWCMSIFKWIACMAFISIIPAAIFKMKIKMPAKAEEQSEESEQDEEMWKIILGIFFISAFISLVSLVLKCFIGLRYDN